MFQWRGSCVVIQSDWYNKLLDTTIVIPFSSKMLPNHKRPDSVPVVNNPVLDFYALSSA